MEGLPVLDAGALCIKDMIMNKDHFLDIMKQGHARIFEPVEVLAPYCRYKV